MKTNLNFSVFTRTAWNEMPRIRHQLTNLLTANGHHVTFFQKTSSQISSPEKKSEFLSVVTLPEVMHHQLRPLRQIGDFANSFPKKFILKYYSANPHPDIIVNFNYDFGFLKEIFPDLPMITFINDDFVAQAKPWMKNMIALRVEQTSTASDAVLAVSYPLQKQLSKFNNATFPFLPWAQKDYSSPLKTKDRNVVLYFGYINHRIDFNILIKVAQSGTLLRLIGPIQRTADKSLLQKLTAHQNVTLLPPMLLQDADLSDVCCSILPYDSKVESVNAGSISNRGFSLLSNGIPLVHSALAELIEAPQNVIRYCKSAEDYLYAIEYFKNNFYDVQKDIQSFLSGNYSRDRYESFIHLVNNLILKYNRVEAVNPGY